MNKDRALIVEDSRTIASIVKHFLRREGFEVSVAADGSAGLDTARRERPRLVVTDVNMPGMGGLDMVRALRGDVRTHEMAIFILTSDDSVKGEQEARAAGADDYILKPVEPRHLVARVRAVMDRAEFATL